MNTNDYYNKTVKLYGLRGKGFSARDNIIIKAVKAVHLLAATLWAGGAISMQALTFMRLSCTDTALVDQISACSYFVDTWVVLPGLAGCIGTGIFYSVCTSIGFFKFSWIAYKWLISLSAAFWGMLFWLPLGDKVLQTATELGYGAIMRFIRSCILPESMWQGGFQLAVIFSMCLISVYRPLTFSLRQEKDKPQQQLKP